MNTKSVLTHLIRAGRDALHLEKTLTDLGYKETPYYNLYGEITDALYAMLDERTDTVEESKAYAAVHDIYLPDEICAEELAPLVCTADLPVTVLDVIAEAAQKRGIEPNTMIRLIVSEWAMKEMYANSVLR